MHKNFTWCCGLIIYVAVWMFSAAPCLGQETTGLKIVAGDQQAVIVIRDDWKQSAWYDWGAHGIIRQFLQEQTGRQLEVVKSSTIKRDSAGIPVPSKQVRIWAGRQPEVDRVLGSELDKLDYEGFIIRAIGNDLYVSGNGWEATNFAGHDFLERFTGCRWFGAEPRFWMPKEDGVAGLFDHIPKLSEVIVPASVNIREEPSYKMRFFRTAPVHSFRLSYRDKFHHAFVKLLPAEKYAKEHPEYYGMVNGVRQVPNPGGYSWQPCVGNPDVFRITVDSLLDQLKQGAPSVSLGMNDSNLFCEAPESIAKAPAEITDVRMRAKWAYVDFCNRVAAEVCKQYPAARIGILGYAALQDVPGNIKMHPNIVVYVTRDSAQLFSESEVKEFKETISHWNSRAQHLGIYEYIYGSEFVIPRIYSRYILTNIQNRYGGVADGFYAEAYPNWGLDGPKYYLIARLLWNNKLDPRALEEEYFRLMFGPAAGAMQKYFSFVEEVWCTQTIPDTHSNYRWMSSPVQLDIFSKDKCDQAWAILEQAKAAAGSDALVNKRIDYVQACFALTRTLSTRRAGVHAFLERIKAEPAETPGATSSELMSASSAVALNAWLSSSELDSVLARARETQTGLYPQMLQNASIRRWDAHPVEGLAIVLARATSPAILLEPDGQPKSLDKIKAQQRAMVDRLLVSARAESGNQDVTPLRELMNAAVVDRSVVSIPRDESPATVDGVIQQGEYPPAILSGRFFRAFALDCCPEETTVYAKQSNSLLYVAFDLPQDSKTLGGSVTSNETVGATQTKMAQDDAVVLCMHSPGRSDVGVRINANGAVGMMDPKWAGLKSAKVARRENGWSVELAIDVAATPLGTRDVKSFTMAVARYIRRPVMQNGKLQGYEADAYVPVPLTPMQGIIGHGNHPPLMSFISGPVVVRSSRTAQPQSSGTK